MRILLLIGGLFAGSFAQASEIVRCNQHGAVVTLEDGTVLYLGNNCDAARKGGGSGRWWNAASFIGVQIGDRAYMVAEGSGIDCLPYCALG